jgi:hypothetical protein
LRLGFGGFWRWLGGCSGFTTTTGDEQQSNEEQSDG